MAHQYSSAPSYGAQYQPTPFYPPFAPPPQQTSNGPASLVQPNTTHHPGFQPPTTLSNNMRFDTNAHNTPQPVPPLPFSPHFNPELLKHFPPPPPPPIPGMNFPGFPHFPPVANATPHQSQQSPYPYFPPPPAIPVHATPSSTQNINPAQDPRLFNPAASALENENMINHLRNQSPAQRGTGTPVLGARPGRSTDAIAGFSDTNTAIPHELRRSMDLTQSNSPKTDTQISSTSTNSNHDESELSKHEQRSRADVSVPITKFPKQQDLRERAKSALLSLVPHNIRYADFLIEGVSPSVLQQLYDELGLSWRAPDTENNITTGKTFETKAKQSTSGPLQIPSTVIPGQKALSTVSPNMERKDRIAQLLAAKAGKVSTAGVTSKSQSPASATDVVPNQPTELVAVGPLPETEVPKPTRTAAQTDVVKQKMERLRMETIARVKAEQTQRALAAVASHQKQQDPMIVPQQEQPLAKLPTPVREHLVQNGLSSFIPGLFMTSADEEADNSLAQSFENAQSSSEQSVSSIIDDTGDSPALVLDTNSFQESSRKRLIEDRSPEDEAGQPQAKRQAFATVESASERMDVDEEIDDNASEGEIIEDPPSLDVQSWPANHLTLNTQVEPTVQDYHTKQAEIDTMRKRIYDIEQRQTSKRGQSHNLSPTNSNTSTPLVAHTPQTGLSSPLSKPTDHSLASIRNDDRVVKSPRSLVKATPEEIAERAARLKAEYLRQRALRQKQLQEGIPALNDEVTKTQAKLKETKSELARIQGELQQYEANIVLARSTEDRLLQEIGRLEKQISEGVSGQKHFSNELIDLKQQSTKDTTVAKLSGQTVVQNNSRTILGVTTPKLDDLSQVAEQTKPTTDEPDFVHPIENNVKPVDEHVPSIQDSNDEGEVIESDADNEMTGSAVEDGIDPDNEDYASGDSNSVDNKNNKISVSQRGGLQEDDIDGKYDESDEAMDESNDESEDSRMSIDDESNDSASMSDSGSDDYEPAEPDSSNRAGEKAESDEYEPQTEDHQELDEVADEDADDYEPADVTTVEDASVVPTPSPELNTVDANQADAGISVVSNHDKPDTRPVVDDQEQGLQLSEADTLTRTQAIPIDDEMALGRSQTSSVRYAPYQSPLSHFKSYRFNASFNKQVRDGYRSLTYSHKIDPTLPVCPLELNGITCTDPDCQDQHFGSMAMTDDKILVQMSSASDIKDKSLRDQYLKGLKQVIARLRQEGVKEFSAVADALSQYRRDWTTARTIS